MAASLTPWGSGPLANTGSPIDIDLQKKNRKELYGPNQNRFIGPVHDQLLGWIDGKTGAPFTGQLPGGGYIVNGQWSATPPPGAAGKEDWAGSGGGPGSSGRPSDFPKLVTTVQQPEVREYAKGALQALPGQTAATMSAFDKLMAQEKATSDKLRSTAGEVYDPSRTEGEVLGANKRFEEGSMDVLSRMEQRQKEYEAQQKATQDAKAAELRNYESKAQAVADLAVANAERQRKGAMASAGGNTGWSGAQGNAYARIYAGVNTPLQAELSQRRTGLLGEEGALSREYLANDNARLSFNQALNESFRGNTVQAAQYLQNLRTTLRGLDAAEQDRLLAREADMLGLGQKLRAGEITTAQLLQALERSAVDFTYQQPFDPTRIAPTASWDPSAPTRNSEPRSYVPGSGQTRTGSPGQTNNPSGIGEAGPVRGYVPDWMRGLTPQQLYDYDRRVTGQRQVTGVPFDPNRSSGGAGWINDTPIGANEWQNQGTQEPLTYWQ